MVHEAAAPIWRAESPRRDNLWPSSPAPTRVREIRHYSPALTPLESSKRADLTSKMAVKSQSIYWTEFTGFGLRSEVGEFEAFLLDDGAKLGEIILSADDKSRDSLILPQKVKTELLLGIEIRQGLEQ